MLKKVALCALCGLFASACVVVDDDDGTTTNSSVSSSASATNTTTSASTSSGSGGETEDTTDPSTTTATTAGTEGTSSAGSTGGSSACGWGETGQTDVPNGYVCGGDGADPDGMWEMGCPSGFDLSVGADCNQDDAELTGVGCCDAEGNVWFCEDDGSGPQLNTESCG